MALSETSLCNTALSKIGSKRINNIETDSSEEAIQCRLHYEPTRDSLLCMFKWPFAIVRVVLSEDTNAPAFNWENQFILPTDFLRLITIDEIDDTLEVDDRFSIENHRILTNESTISIVYVKKVTDVTRFDPLFVEVLVLQLALKLLPSLSGAGTGMMGFYQILYKELALLFARVRVIHSAQTNVTGRSDWNLARFGS